MKTDELPFDLMALQVFSEVCQTGSMSRAAASVKLTQSAVSQTIKQLEKKLGVTLFDRRLRPLGLTPAAVMLRERARQLLEDARQISPSLRQIAKARLSVLRIAVTESMALTFSARLAKETAEIAAQTAILTGTSQSQAEGLFKRQLDIVISVDPLEDAEGLERYLLASEPYVLVVPTKLAKVRNIRALVSSDVPYLSFASGSYTGIAIDRHLRRMGIQIERRHEFDASRIIVDMIARGQGWAIMTPLGLAGTGTRRDKNALRVHPLAPTLYRRLTLTARAGELGNVPQRIAKACREVVRDDALKYLENLIPWLQIGADGGGRFHVPN